MLDWVQRLQSRGVKTGILSNMGDRMTDGLVRKLAWLDVFDHLTWSHALGLAKPEPAIYRHAIAGLGTAPEEILFVDDRAENIAAAHQAGINAVQYTSWPEFLTSMRDAGFADLVEDTDDAIHRAAPATQSR